jgi:hypothetical protein
MELEVLIQAAEDYCNQHKHDNETEKVLCKADFKAGAIWAVEYLKTQNNDSTNHS